MFLPFVTETWQVYLLILVLQSASATFTPAFQALIPSVLPEERDYTRAMSLSRLAYDLEALVSPFLDRLTRGVRVFVARRELRVLAGLDLVVAAATAMVLVNTAVLVQVGLGRPQADVAVLLAAYGAGSMLVALAVPRLLDRVPDLPVMTAGAAALPVLLAAAAATIALEAPWALLLVLWLTTGAATSAVLPPLGPRAGPQRGRDPAARRVRRPVLPLPRVLPGELPRGRPGGLGGGAARGGPGARRARCGRTGRGARGGPGRAQPGMTASRNAATDAQDTVAWTAVRGRFDRSTSVGPMRRVIMARSWPAPSTE